MSGMLSAKGVREPQGFFAQRPSCRARYDRGWANNPNIEKKPTDFKRLKGLMEQLLGCIRKDTSP
jgi:hypothetical protein